MTSSLFKMEVDKFREHYLDAIIHYTSFNVNTKGSLKYQTLKEMLKYFDNEERYKLLHFYKEQLENFLTGYKDIAKEQKRTEVIFKYDKYKFVMITYLTIYEENTNKRQTAERREYIYFHKVKEKIKFLNSEISYYDKYEKFDKDYEFSDTAKNKFIWLGTKQDLFFLFNHLENLGFVYSDNVNDILKKYFTIYDSKNMKFETLKDSTVRDYKSKVKAEFTLLKESEKMRDVIKAMSKQNPQTENM